MDKWQSNEAEPFPIFYSERKIEKFYYSQYPAKRFGEFSSFFTFEPLVNTSIFIDVTQNKLYLNYIENNLSEIKNDFKKYNRDFTIIPKVSNQTDKINYKYYFPLKYLNFENFDGINKDSYENFDKYLLNFLGYKGETKTGLLTITNGNVTFVEKLAHENIDIFFDKFLKNIIYKDDRDQLTVMYSLNSTNKNKGLPLIKIDDETLEKVENIKLNLQELVESGNFFLVAPMIEKILNESFAIGNKVSPIKITTDYKILLTDYDMEVEMSHLTKSVYFLFLQANEPIDITNLEKHRNKLLNIYKHITNKNSLEEIENTIFELTQPNNTNIYMHISRVKSAFAKLFSNTNDYIINGVRGEPKSIFLNKDLIIWEGEF